MYTPLIGTNDGAGSGYGLGWYVGAVRSQLSDRRIVFHPGDADGNSDYVSFMPDEGLGVIVLTNQHCTQDLVEIWPNRVATAIYDHLLHGRITGQLVLPPRPAPFVGAAAAGAAAMAAPAVAPAIAAPGDYTGMFSDCGYGDMVVSRFGNNLSISYYGLSWPLQPLTDTLFRFDVLAFGTDFPVFVKFVRGSTGAIESFAASLVVHPVLLWIPFRRR
jgi:Beta-lactamase